MTGNHATELEIQQYVFDKTDCPNQIVEHIESCDGCAARAAGYRLIFTGIKQYPKPVLDFDLEKTVLEILPKSPSAFSPETFLAYAVSIALMAGIGVIGYLYKDYLLRVFAGILPIAVYLVIITGVTVCVLQVMDMYKTYQKKIRVLKSM